MVKKRQVEIFCLEKGFKHKLSEFYWLVFHDFFSSFFSRNVSLKMSIKEIIGHQRQPQNLPG